MKETTCSLKDGENGQRGYFVCLKQTILDGSDETLLLPRHCGTKIWYFCEIQSSLQAQIWSASCLGSRFGVLSALSKESRISEGQEAGFCNVFMMSFFTLFLFMWYLKRWNTLI